MMASSSVPAKNISLEVHDSSKKQKMETVSTMKLGEEMVLLEM